MASSNKHKASKWITPVFSNMEEANETYFNTKSFTGNYKLWVDEFPPQTKDELAVHKKKVTDVQLWIEESLQGKKGRKILLLMGPSGTGKSSTIRVIAKELNILVKDWKNPPLSKYENLQPLDSYVSQENKFAEFILRGSKYGTVCRSQGQNNSGGKSLILIEELPNTYIFDPSKFYPILRNFSHLSGVSAIFVLSESGTDEKLIRKLFPSDLQQELSITSIAYNPIAPSLLSHALNRIIDCNVKKATQMTSTDRPSKEFLTHVAEGSNGDLRSAINSLQFAMEGAPEENMKQMSSTSKIRKKSLKVNPKNATASFTFGSKDSNLLIFRSLGKILYCKRKGNSVLESLPRHLKACERMPLQENPEDVFEKTNTDASTISLFLHHNCPYFFSSIESLAKALHYIGDADIIGSHWTGSEILDLYHSSICLRGLMHHLHSKESKSSFRPLTKPKWFAITKLTKERKYQLRHISKAFSAATDKEVSSLIVPFLAKIGGGTWSSNERRLYEDVGIFAQTNNRISSCDDADADIDDTEITYGSPMSEIPYQTPECDEVTDDDYLIEEYDD